MEATATNRPWPMDELQAFVLRMADHGHSVSGTWMKHDMNYAIAQLNHAHTMADETLRELAVKLFRLLDVAGACRH